MRVKVPRELAGGSLLKAHRWVKSNMTKSNPSGSADDYKLQAVDGTPLSLSDLTSRTFDEVLLISGSKNNPGNYPPALPKGETWGYPSYKKNRLGNRPTVLLAKDVDPSMVERLAMQNGMFSALNTITKLMYSEENMESGSDPKIAALLQRYANAAAKTVKSNPGRPFFASSINDAFKGVVSSEEAVRSYVTEEYGLTPGHLNDSSDYMISKARILKMYDLGNEEIFDEFMDDVLSPFLLVSLANARLLKTLRHQNYSPKLKKLLGNNPDVKTQKLVSMIPTHAEQFYDGMDYALIAHPLFMRESLGLTVMNDKVIKHITKIVKKYPENTKDAVNSRTKQIKRSFLQNIIGSVERDLVWQMVKSQHDVLRDNTNHEELLEALKQITSDSASDAKMVEFALKLKPDVLVSYQRDVAGFRPTAPPYWPKPVVMALMDTVRNHLHAIIEKPLDVSAAFASVLATREVPPEYQKLDEHYKRLKPKDLEIDTKIIALNNEKIKELTDWKINSRFRDVVIDRSNVVKAIDEIGYFLERKTTSIESKDSKTLHVLSIFMEIEDTSRSKYNYTMSENDRAFALYLLEKVMDKFSSTTDDKPAPLSEELKQGQKLLDTLRGYTDEGNNADQLRDQLALLGHLSAVKQEAIGKIKMADDDKVQGIVDNYEARFESFKSKREAPNWLLEQYSELVEDLKVAAAERTE